MAETKKHDAPPVVPVKDETLPPARTPEGHLNTKNPTVAQQRMATPAAPVGTHEEADPDTGALPLPEGAPRNPPGSIPRSPGEWPSGKYPPEYAKGPMPAEQADAHQQKRTQKEAEEQTRIEQEKAKKK